jgi:hypothetical protein
MFIFAYTSDLFLSFTQIPILHIAEFEFSVFSLKRFVMLTVFAFVS